MRRDLALAVLVLGASAWFLAPGEPPSPPEIRLKALVRSERLRKPYAGNLAPEAAEGWRFGAVGLDENGSPMDLTRRFAYWAAPGTYRKGLRTFLVDETGTLYAKDLGHGGAVEAWPASDPTAKGWRICSE